MESVFLHISQKFSAAQKSLLFVLPPRVHVFLDNSDPDIVCRLQNCAMAHDLQTFRHSTRLLSSYFPKDLFTYTDGEISKVGLLLQSAFNNDALENIVIVNQLDLAM